MSIVRWEEPPPPLAGRTRTRGTWDPEAVAEALRSRPGQWALVLLSERYGCTANAVHIRSGSRQAFRPAGAFEATSRELPEGYAVYARYVGGGGS